MKDRDPWVEALNDPETVAALERGRADFAAGRVKKWSIVRRRTVALHRGPHKDPVTTELREYVLRRDGSCVMYQFDARHVCRDKWGLAHAPWALSLLTIEHVKPQLAMGRRGPSEARWLVALCHGANVAVPSKEARAFFRGYLAQVEA